MADHLSRNRLCDAPFHVVMDPVPLRRRPVAEIGRRDTMADEPAVPRSFPVAFADALRRRGVSLAWLHERLVERGRPVSPAALSYWRSGRSQPERGTSREALVEIERLLRVAPGSLIDRLGPSRRPGPRPGEKTVRELFGNISGSSPPSTRWASKACTTSWSRRCGTSPSTSTRPVGRRPCRCGWSSRRAATVPCRSPLIVTLDEPDWPPTFIPAAWMRLGGSEVRSRGWGVRGRAAD